MRGRVRVLSGLVAAALLSSGCLVGGAARLDSAVPAGEAQAGVGWETTASRDRSRFASLYVDNRSGRHVTVRLNGRRVGTATRGRTCIRIPQMAGELRLEFAAHGERAFSAPIVFLEESAHWGVEFRPGITIKYDVLSLGPRRDGCRS